VVYAAFKKKEKEIHDSFAAGSQSVAPVHEKCLAKMEKSAYLCIYV
jgi:hypothetical protein